MSIRIVRLDLQKWIKDERGSGILAQLIEDFAHRMQVSKKVESLRQFFYNIDAQGDVKRELHQGQIFLAAIENESLVGLSQLHCTEGNELEIRFIAVDPAYQLKKVGRNLYLHALGIGRTHRVKKVIMSFVSTQGKAFGKKIIQHEPRKRYQKGKHTGAAETALPVFHPSHLDLDMKILRYSTSSVKKKGSNPFKKIARVFRKK